MSAIEALTTINPLTIIFGLFVILAAVKYMLEIISWFKKKSGTKTGYELKEEEKEKRIETLEKHDKFQFETIQQVLQGIADIKESLEKTDKRLDSIEVRNMRSSVLDFASGIIKGNSYTIQEYDNIKSIIAQYENLVDTKNIPNGQLEHAIIVINKSYDELIESDGFLK